MAEATATNATRHDRAITHDRDMVVVAHDERDTTRPYQIVVHPQGVTIPAVAGDLQKARTTTRADKCPTRRGAKSCSRRGLTKSPDYYQGRQASDPQGGKFRQSPGAISPVYELGNIRIREDEHRPYRKLMITRAWMIHHTVVTGDERDTTRLYESPMADIWRRWRTTSATRHDHIK